MIKRLAIYISVLVVFILSATTGLYFAQSKKLIMDDVKSQAELILTMKKNGIEDFLDKAKYLTLAVSEDTALKGYFKGNTTNKEAEDLFMNYCSKIDDIQAMRLVDINGDIKVFVRECENLSGQSDYEPINLSNRYFFRKVRETNPKLPIFSNFERGHLPDATSFCPSMIRALIPVFENEKVLGYLIVNFWGSKIGETVSQMDNRRGISFITEINRIEAERNGVFLFHNDRKLEFANQFGTSYFFENVYGGDAMKWLAQEKNPILNIEDGYMFCTTLTPYQTTAQAWKICTILKEDYFFRSLSVLRRDFLAVMFFSIILSILTAVVFSRYFMKPFAEIKNAAKAYSEGDFDYQLSGEYKGEIQEITESIQSMADSLKKYIENIKDTQTKLELMNRLSALGVMAGGIAHELNTPLNSIKLLTKLVKEELPENNEDLDCIQSEADRCVDIINNLRKLAPNSSEGDPEIFDLKTLIEKTVKYLNMSGRITAELEEVSIKGYPTLIQQVIINLLQNAADASEKESSIHIRLTSSDNQCKLTVTDEGKGMNQSEIDKIFDPFHTTKSPDKGMGLGLSLVYNIIKKHNGQITVESAEGSGTTFTVKLEKSDESSAD
jgi:signal transduction histidine kinase